MPDNDPNYILLQNGVELSRHRTMDQALDAAASENMRPSTGQLQRVEPNRKGRANVWHLAMGERGLEWVAQV